MPAADDLPLPADNPFATPSELPFGLPPFDRIDARHFTEAFTAGMAQHRSEVAGICDDPEPAGFENTLEALERSGRLLGRVASVFFNLTSSATDDELNAIEAQVAPRLAAHSDAIRLDPRLFARLRAVHDARADLGLDGEQARLLERYHLDFVRAGAALDADRQSRLREINTELSTLTTAFRTKLMAETNDLAVHIDSARDLAGMPDDAIAAAGAAARTRGLDGYLLTLILPTGQPALATLADRTVRERLHRASIGRCLRGNDYDTRETVVRLVELRAERARLLGFPDHAAYVVADQTAGSSEAVSTMLGGLVAPAVSNARIEAAELEALLIADGGTPPLQPWDWAYYAGRVRRERYQVDAAALRPYFELDRVVRDGVFRAAQELYGLRFEPRTDLPGYHADVRTYQVIGPDGVPLGLFLADWYARDSKRGGAWMSTFVDQSHLLGERPVVVINLNIPRPPDGEPTLLTLDEVGTAFHEFGHVLHGLLSDVRYPRLSGTSVPRDFVEFPSQVNEMWAMWPELLSGYAVHHATGEPLPQDVVDRVIAAQSYGEGFATTEYLAAALLDLEWHRRRADDAPVPPSDVESFERDALERHGIALELIPPRYRSSYFSHIFAGGYSAGYYSYIWSEVLDADTVDWFSENGGLSRANGEVFARELLSRGGSVDPMAAFEAVRGRPPRVEPLLKRRGLTPSPATPV
ncbi:MAG TPA: M3 family metallopeptidase, partial [Kineosporiaceae bacterium]|nr:M3 family metallopeptidase [Kineosporiaceae bacterium]